LKSLEIKSKKINKQSIFYHHQIEIKPRVSEIERKTVAAGRFILATNIESSSAHGVTSKLNGRYSNHLRQ
jgi:hypothetical protein